MAALPEVLAEMGSTAALVVVERPVAGIPSVAAAVAGLAVFEKEPGEPTAELIEALVQRMRAGAPDALVAIGGGSALDLAKGARAALLAATCRSRACWPATSPWPSPSLGLVTVPTTAGTGSEVSGGCVVVDRASGRKRGVASPLMRAQHALVDPLLTVGLPPAATMQTGADALAQAIGGVIVRNGNPGSVALGLEACVHVAAGLAPAVADGGDRDGAVAPGPRQPDGRSGDEPVRLRRRPRARACPRRPARDAARPERRPRPGRDARRRPGGVRGGARAGGRRPRRAAPAGRATGPAPCAPCAGCWPRWASRRSPAAGVGIGHVDALVPLALGRLLPDRQSPHAWSEDDVRAAYAAALRVGSSRAFPNR